ncbi:carboxypeptidase-like regulatory domain-containing protein [uncultured Winogradskyella sp.]|uniref:carboxypeptidase-like regulatory domain-containing protein n=1 Tax=uncultured Winogradskyella sp. TaxID=395353 RepID=UPI0030D9211C|tara:strand:- start:129448 stop:130467 length:1020 start_codon:yes stop_codon:yes gene_type:complete
MISSLKILLYLLPLFCVSQTLTGRVIDKLTNKPVETVAVYFDNTTIGTTTKADGSFSISYTDAVQSTLVISYLGYEKVFIDDYRKHQTINIALVAATNALDEVYLNYDDGLTRKQKLKLFRREFLGTSEFASSCKILNEKDLNLRYDKQNKSLYASSKVPVTVRNKAFQYEIDFEIIDFELRYKYVDVELGVFNLQSVVYTGTSFFKNLKKSNTKKARKNRAEAYKGSVRHFMRSLYNKNLLDQGYWVFYDSFRVNEWAYFTVEAIQDSDLKKVTLKHKVSLLYNKDLQSELQLEVDHFIIDFYGNYEPIVGVYFSGNMGSQRVGDTLPSDYGLTLITN